MSLLLAHGHSEAWSYPLGHVVQETDLVVTRLNQQMAMNAVIIQSAVSAVPNGFIEKSVQQKLFDGFSSLLKRLGGG